jgi:hypothetical protein
MNGCRPGRRLVSQGSFCTVEECVCGVLHVTIGVLTIRLQTDVVASIWETLGEALSRLAAGRRALTTDTASRAPERPS